MLWYNLFEHSSNYFDTTSSLWFNFKDETTSFNNDIAINDGFKSFKNKANLLGNNEADGANGVLRNTIVAVPLKYLSNFWRLL